LIYNALIENEGKKYPYDKEATSFNNLWYLGLVEKDELMQEVKG